MYLSKWYTTIFLVYLFKLIQSSFNNKYINEFVVRCPGGYSEAKSVATQMGFNLHRKLFGFDDFFLFKYKSNANEKMKFQTHRLRRSVKVDWVEQQVLLKRVKRHFITKSFNFIDPLYEFQWYLMRSDLNKNKVDMNVVEAWKMGYTGKGVIISILDDGIDYRHDDLKDNYDRMASFDLNGDDDDPIPNFKSSENRHGTRCAGEVSAKANNSQCGVGVAYNSKIGAIRMLDGEVTDRVEAEALSYKQQYIDIYSGSWGPDDNGQRVEGPARLAKAAFERGTKFGRNGLGNIYVWASGNGGKKKDSCACDGYASSIHTISISSVSELNLQPWYLESCASTLASTYSSGNANEKKIISTDLNNKCASDHTGTSASAPLAAGIIALLIEANRNLTWRDVQYIIVMTANTKPFIKGEFILNGANRKVSNWYGFGLMDTGKIVRLGRLWNTLPPQHLCKVSLNNQKLYLSQSFKVNLSVMCCECKEFSKVNFIEHVILYLKLEYQRRGDLRIHLISPAGTKSEILPFRPFDSAAGPTTFDIWPLMSVQFWGESPLGLWSVEIDNSEARDKNLKGLWTSFHLEIYGTEKWPVHLKSPDKDETDNWFQQFERLVVQDTNENLDLRIPIYSRGHMNTNEDVSFLKIFECDKECFNNTCSGPGPENCDTCINYQTYKGICVSKCTPGLFLDNISKVCEPCHSSCDECLGYGKFNCSRCHVGDIYLPNTKQCQISVSDCPKGYFKEKNDCVKCSLNCAVCISSTVCSQCDDPFVLTLQSKCSIKCNIGSYPDSRKRCRVCHIDCLSCQNGDMSSCTSCNHGSFINSLDSNHSFGKCVKECPNGYFTNHTVGFCYKCHQNCKTCTGPSSEMCTDCIPPLELSRTGHTCIDPVSYNCRPGEFKSSNSICEKCPSDCQTCSENRCTSCSSNRYLFNNSCISKCPVGYFLFLNLKTCLSCFEYCSPCDIINNFNQCSQCFTNETVCNTNCSKGKYWNSRTKNCDKCHFSCRHCFGGSNKECILCNNHSLVLLSGKCLTNCPENQYSITSSIPKCFPCHQSCENLSCNSVNGKCLKCPIGHKLADSGICERIITCSISEYWDKNQKICLNCDPSCRSCFHSNLCSSCSRNFCLDAYSSTCQPCCVSSLQKNCSKCLFGREICIPEDKMLISSMSLLIFQYPVRVLLILSIGFILLFLTIITYFYAGKIFAFLKFYNRKKSVKYEKLKSNVSLSDNSDNDSIGDRSSIAIEINNSVMSDNRSSFLDVVELRDNEERNGFNSSSKVQLSKLKANYLNGKL